MNDHAFSLVTGVLALVSAIASILGYYHSRLPNQRMEMFDKIFSHSKELFSRARKDGLITASLWRAVSGRSSGMLEASSLEARARINTLIEDAEALRLSITISAQQQLRLQRHCRDCRYGVECV
ncbi:hypothetical protein BD779DRAFT_1493075 [Infundibulicybe gibba]|nr:hypothetical protein BD779DRAFT_1493075 [Infundibulicybe gibba]